ncbi:MAG: RNA polymerase sigma factor [Muribaculaceae bacterium]|nr:RNA polymerase sigma factor [Muribaculaceae bacterium]
MIEPDEQTLIDLVRRGDRTAMRLMYSKYIGHLTAVCSRYVSDDEDVKDVLQDSFIKIFDSLSDFVYRGDGSLKAWVTRIVINESLRLIRSRSLVAFVMLENDVPAVDETEQLPDIETVPPEVIHSLIRNLPDGYRTVFNLYVVEGRSHREISKMLGISENTSASQLHRAKNALAEAINQYKTNSKYGRHGQMVAIDPR